jgi:CBS domain-containing protein
MLVRDLMQTEVVTLGVRETLDLADDIMRLGRIRHLPVTDGGRLVGVLSQRDLYRAGISSMLQLGRSTQHRFLAKVPVQAAMTPSPYTIGPDAPVRTAIRLMLEWKVGCLPVVDDDTLVGLIAESDCLRYLEHVLAVIDTKRLLPELRASV